MSKLHKLSDSQIDSSVLGALREEHRQTRRPVSTEMLCIAVNAADAIDQEAVMLALVRLKRVGRIERGQIGYSSGWLPLVGTKHVAQKGNAKTASLTRAPMAAAPRQAVAGAHLLQETRIDALGGRHA